MSLWSVEQAGGGSLLLPPVEVLGTNTSRMTDICTMFLSSAAERLVSFQGSCRLPFVFQQAVRRRSSMLTWKGFIRIPVTGISALNVLVGLIGRTDTYSNQERVRGHSIPCRG